MSPDSLILESLVWQKKIFYVNVSIPLVDNSTKSSKEKEKADKIQKDLALTRDLPWCGCWGNGCL